MHFDDLQKIVHLAHTQSIQKSANALNVTSGALSKTLKKIENKLKTPLFDRVGRNIELNAQGKKFTTYASNLIQEYEQMCSEFTDKKVKHHLKISGPSVLLEASLAMIIPLLPDKNIEMNIETLYEGDAIIHLANGQSHVAIVTDAALTNLDNLPLNSVPLGKTTCKVIASHQHPIFKDFPEGKVKMSDLLNYPFICPKTSPYCGIERGIGSDGWLDHKYPRIITFRSDDINSLLSVVNQSVVLAYVADIVIDTDKVRVVEIIDCPIEYQENYSLVYRSSKADGWLNQLVYKLENDL